jgi:hypothetical protein
MNYDLQIAHSVEEIGEEAWDSLSEDRVFSSYKWYAFGEKVLVNCPPTYILLSRGGRPAARATFWLKRQEWLPITSKPARFGAERLLERWPLFTCEAPLISISGLLLPETDDQTVLLEKIALTARELAKQTHAIGTIFSYIPANEARQAAWPKSYSPISYSDAETSLELDWVDFESYIKHLAKSTRRNIKLHNKAADELAIAIKTHSSVTALDEAINLIQNVETHHKVGHRPWTRAMLQNAGMVESQWISAWCGDHLAGCCSIFGDGTARTATLLGLDYSYSQWIHVYYQLIYAVVRCAIESGCKLLYGGGGAYELKRRLGFRRLPDDYLMIEATGRLMDGLLKGSFRWMGAQGPVEDADDKTG